MLNGAFERLFELEGGFADIDGDRGGVTYMGISSRQYPELKDEILNKRLDVSEVKRIYREDYWNQIVRIDELERKLPDVAWLIFIGKVHGAGDNHLVELIQRWSNSKGYNLVPDGIWGPKTAQIVLNLVPSEVEDLRKTIDDSIWTLSNRRAASVGIKSEAIRRRVEREHLIARGYRDSRDPIVVEELNENSERWIRIKTATLEFKIREV